MKRKKLASALIDTLITVGTLLAATGLCLLLRLIDDSNIYVSMLFLLAVFLIARFTSGYVYGLCASVASVLCVNFIFTYPYFAFNFTMTGYPLTIVSMLLVAVITSALTSRIKQQEQLSRAAQREKMRSELLRAVSHDLRTPITSIIGTVSAVMDSGDLLTSGERNALLASAKDDAQWMISMVENLLTVTRMEEGASVTKQPEAAEEICADALSRFRKRYPATEILVSVPDELLLVPMDAMLIEQVIMNLMENAVLHAAGMTRAALSVTREGSFVRFSVCDDGAGIDGALLPHIFEAESLPSTDSTRNMGIGLSVCRAIVMAHGGEITAKNDGGACFSFTLPLEERL